MGQDVEDVSGLGVDDRKSVNLVLDQGPDGLEETRVRVDKNEIFDITESI